MNHAETHDVLRLAASFDNRRFDDVAVIAWQAALDDIPFADGRAALLDHFRESAEYLMPVHIRRGALYIDRERRRAERERSERLALEAEASEPTRYDRSDETRALIAALRDSLPEGDPDKLRRPEWLEHDKRRDRERNAVPNPHYDPDAHTRLEEIAAASAAQRS